jgi:hypothetical protein
MMLATADWNLISNISSALGIIGALIISIVAVSRKTEVKVTPNPMPVEMVEKLATKAELKEEEYERKKQEGILHKRITEGRKEMDATLRDLPMQIVTLLRNTGNLR